MISHLLSITLTCFLQVSIINIQHNSHRTAGLQLKKYGWPIDLSLSQSIHQKL
jgi:hypothetical protein